MLRIVLAPLGLCAVVAGCAADGGKGLDLVGVVEPVAFACPAEGLKTKTVNAVGQSWIRTWHGASAEDPVLCKFDKEGVAIFGDQWRWNNFGADAMKGAHDAWAAAFEGKTDKSCFQYAFLSYPQRTCIVQLGKTTVKNAINVSNVVVFNVHTQTPNISFDRNIYFDIGSKIFVEQKTDGVEQSKYNFVPLGWTQTIM